MAAVFHTQYINANCSNMVKDTDFIFDKNVHRESPNVTPRKIFDKGAWPGSRDSLIFLGVKCKLLEYA